MKILWLTVDRSHRIAHHFDDFREAVSSIAEVHTLKKYPAGDKGQNMWQLSRNLLNGETKVQDIVLDHLQEYPSYDFIFCDAFFAYTEEPWNNFSIPSAIFIEDVHHEVPRTQIARAKDLGIKTIFHRFNFAFHRLHPSARADFTCIWLPHSIKTSRYTDTVPKSIEVLHVGVCPKKYYPYRATVVDTLKDKPYFKRIVRPKEQSGTSRTSQWPIGKDYDNLLQSSKICITGGSIFNAPVQKYVEIPASGSLLMSNWFSDLGLLGFVPNENMIVYHLETIVKDVENILKDPDKIFQITESALDLITFNHTSQIRAKQFINNICGLINKEPEFPNTKPCSFQANFKSFPKPTTEPVQSKPKPIPRQKIPRLKRIHGVPKTDWKSRIEKAKR